MAFWAEGEQKKPATLLAERLGIPKINRRQQIWLWLWLSSGNRVAADALPPFESCGGGTMPEAILNTLGMTPTIRSVEIRAAMDACLLPEEQLAWIGDGERQLSWLLRRLRGKISYLHRNIVRLTPREELIVRLDILDATLAEKQSLMADIYRDWRAQVARDSDFDWFLNQKEEVERCKCAWEWLEKRYLRPRHFRQRFDTYQGLLQFFDQEDMERAKQQEIVRKIKQRWSRQQLDVRNSDCKQVNVMLPTATISKLDHLVKKHGMSRAKIVAKLIDDEAEARGAQRKPSQGVDSSVD